MFGAAGNLNQPQDLEAALKAKHHYEQDQASRASLADLGDGLASQVKEVAAGACTIGKSAHASFASRACFLEALLTSVVIDAAVGVTAIPVAIGVVAGACVVQSAVLVGGCAVAAGAVAVEAVSRSTTFKVAKFTVKTAAYLTGKAVQEVRDLL